MVYGDNILGPLLGFAGDEDDIDPPEENMGDDTKEEAESDEEETE